MADKKSEGKQAGGVQKPGVKAPAAPKGAHVPNLGPGKATNQIRFDFAKLDVKGLKPLADQFKKQGCPIAVTEADNKARRDSGIQVKRFEIEFEDGQHALFRVKADGTVYQVRLNNKVLALHSVDDMKKAVKEICDAWYDNKEQYQKQKVAREKRMAKAAVAKEKKPAVKSTRRERIEKGKEDLARIEQEIADAEAKRDQIRKEREAYDGTIGSVAEELDREKKRFVALTAEYNALKDQAAKLAA